MKLYIERPVPVESASAFIDEKIKELEDWRGKTLAKMREIIHDADPEIQEEWFVVAQVAHLRRRLKGVSGCSTAPY